MRNLKRFLAMTLTMLMVVGCFVMTSSAKFDDVTDFQNEITILSNLGVIKGLADGTFGFDQSVTRRQEALFIARAATGKVTDTVWTSTVNNSAFKDLDATGDYYGAISYCANLGIIKGRTTTEFYPNDNIIFQEAVAMAVRALGYGSATMDAGYPYTFYDKAVSLGLDKGLEDVALTDVVSRGVAAKLLYNTLFAVTSDGVTLASTAFGATVKSTNLVLIATDSKKLVTNYTLPTAAGTVAFCEFNSDGSLNLDKTYNLNWSNFATLAFGDATKKAADFVGASFAVTTIDGFKTLASVAENTTKTYTQADATGSGTIAGTAYTLVDKWSTVFTTGTTFNGGTELIQFNTAYTKGILTGNTAFYGNHWYVVDGSNNILATDGSVLLYYMPTTSGNTVFPFCYKIGTSYYPAYLPVDGSAYAGAATVDQLSAKSSYATDKNAAKYTSNVSAYADTVAYDDDNDGTYDRAYFTGYKFGQYKITDDDGDGYKEYKFTLGAQGKVIYTYGDNNDAAVDVTINNISGKDLKDGSYVLWARDSVNNSITIKKIFDTVKTGYVTGVNVVNKTLTFIDTLTNYGLGLGTSQTVSYGVAKLPGATNTNNDLSINDDGTGENGTEALIGISYNLQYKQISYIVDDEHDNKIIAIVNAKTADTPLVVTADSMYNYFSYTSLGYVQANVIDSSGTAQVITISRIDNIPALNYFYTGYVLDEGDLVFGAKQDDGTWIIDTNTTFNYYAPSMSTLTFNGGYAYENLNPFAGENKVILDNSDATTFSFKADGTTLVIIVNNGDGTYTISKGIPTNLSTLTIYSGSYIYCKNGYMYVTGDEYAAARFSFTGWTLSTSYETGTANDVIYLQSAGLISAANGYTYSGNYVSVLTGAANGDIGALITSATILTTGQFYEVTKTAQNGTTILNVVGVADMSTAYIKSFASNYAEVVNANGTPFAYVTGKEVHLYDWSATNLATEITAQPAAGKYYKVLVYRGDAVNGNKRIYLVTDKAYTVPGDVYTLSLGTNTTWDAATQTFTVGYTATKNSASVTDIGASTVSFKITSVSDLITYVGTATVTTTGSTITLTNVQYLIPVGGSNVPTSLGVGQFVLDLTVTYSGNTDTLSFIGTNPVILP